MPSFMNRALCIASKTAGVHDPCLCDVCTRCTVITPGPLTLSLFLTIIANETKDTPQIEYLKISLHVHEGSSMR